MLSLSHLTDNDISGAVRIAKRYLEPLSTERKRELKSYLSNVFELWKNDFGEVYKGGLSGGLLADLNRPLVTGEERLAIIKTRAPWQCLPLHERRTPIDLLFHIWENEYPRFDDNYLLELLSLLIVDNATIDSDPVRASITRAGFSLALITIGLNDSRNRKQAPILEREHKRKINHQTAGEERKKRKNTRVINIYRNLEELDKRPPSNHTVQFEYTKAFGTEVQKKSLRKAKPKYAISSGEVTKILRSSGIYRKKLNVS